MATSEQPAASEQPAPSETPAGALTCDDMTPAVATITEGLIPSPDDSSVDPSSTACVWITPETEDGGTDFENYGALSIVADDTSWSASELQSLPGNLVDDPRAAALGGRILLLGEGDTLPQVGSVQLLYPEGTITLVVTGAFLAEPESIDISVDDAIAAAVGVAELR